MIPTTQPPGLPAKVEITEICDRRRRSRAEGPISGELTLNLFFATPLGDGPPPALYCYDKIHVEPIYDDLGTRLSPDSFADDLEYLRTHQKIFGVNHFDGGTARQGPVLELGLGVPARRASRIPRLAGCVVVASGRHEKLTIKDLVKAANKPIDSPLLVGLEITPAIREDEGKTIVSLLVKGNPERIYVWNLVKDDPNFTFDKEPDRPIKGGVEMNYHAWYSGESEGDLLAGLGMELTVFVSTASHRCDFDLKDIELP